MPLIAGHHLQRVDLPQFAQPTGAPLPAELDTRVVDTLELASLAFSQEPLQTFDKLFHDPALNNVPVSEETCVVGLSCSLSTPELVPFAASRRPGALKPEIERRFTRSQDSAHRWMPQTARSSTAGSGRPALLFRYPRGSAADREDIHEQTQRRRCPSDAAVTP
ncbi:hypothetical protein GCM10008957_49610 [Deinococcus ruber]|uniref:Uncharacterized protein n=1 Tax=Deinococcus ruber TaxID=1848197 RepID=A0A918FDK6_9DEIO|nr:hypothetical protein GCM10008957_49610 [Deinococcus ruber]